MRFLILFFSISVFLLTSCEKDIPNREKSPSVEDGLVDVMFPAENNENIEVALEVNEVFVTLTRENSKGKVIVPLSFEDPSGLFSCENNATFEDGEESATVKVMIGEIKFFEPYKLVITIDESYVNPYKTKNGYFNQTLIVTKADWQIQMTGTYFCPPFGIEAFDIALEYSTTKNAFRIYNYISPGYGLEFAYDDEDNFVVTEGKVDTGAISNGSTVYFETKSISFDEATKTYTIVNDWYLGTSYLFSDEDQFVID